MATKGDQTEAQGGVHAPKASGQALACQLPHALFSIQVLQKQSKKGGGLKLQAQRTDYGCRFSLIISNLVPPGDVSAF